jgi:peptide/nickel transport system permease protein
MTRFLARRVAQAIVVLFIVTVIVFSMLHFLPGSPARALLGIKATPEAIEQFNIANGYNRALPVQYVLYLNRLLHGNLGFSYHYDQSVSSLLVLDLPKSALLVGSSYVIALFIAIPIGILQALRRNKTVDHALTGLAFVSYAMPTFWLGILLLVAFSSGLRLFPPEGPQGATVGAALSDPGALVLPVATLTIVSVAQFSRFMRSAAIDVLVQDYIRTARAAGSSGWRLIGRHVLRNSVLPIITLIGLSLPGVLSGAVVVEALFNYPGMGWLFWTATGAHDFPVLMGFTVVIGAATVVGNLLADIAYMMADPRIRQQAS